MTRKSPFFLTLFISLSSTIFAQSSETLSACQSLYAQYSSHFAWDPLGPHGLQTLTQDPLYIETNTDYWNEGNSKNRAACAFFPGSADEVAFAVQVLNNRTSVPYALKSGGHNPNFGFSSVDQGILISFRPNLAATTLSADGSSADIGPGSRWDEAMTVLDGHGKAVVGGRLGHVGVGGYVLGGGLSFLSNQYGFTVDTLLNVELVLADGTIANANRTSNTDLFWALQGGGNQFGIVTKYTLQTFPIGQIWGGTRTYAGTEHAAVFGATTNFTANNADPKAAIIVTTDYTLDDLVSIHVVFFFYDGPAPPAAVFADFDAIPSLLDSTKSQSYPALLTANNEYTLTGSRYQIREGTYPNLPYANMTAFLDHHYDVFAAAAFSHQATAVDVQVYSFAVQPVPVGLINASAAAGGNRLGLDPANGDRIFMEYDVSWLNPACDAACPGYIEQMQTQIHDYHQATFAGVPPTHYESGDLEFISYNPIFMNDGMYDQQVLQSYGDETYQRLKQIQVSRDPTGFFAQRQGGFKFDT